MRDLAFFIFAGIVLAGAAIVVSARSLVRAAYGLAATLAATAGIYLLLTAPLLAAVQILLYTGGVLTLVVFAIVVTGASAGEPRFRRPLAAIAAALAVFSALASVLPRLGPAESRGGLDDGGAIGASLFGDYLVPFELLSVLLLGAVFGALLIARKDRSQ